MGTATKPRYVCWRVKDMLAFSHTLKFEGRKHKEHDVFYERGECARCHELVLHQPRNSEGRRIVCWKCS